MSLGGLCLLSQGDQRPETTPGTSQDNSQDCREAQSKDATIAEIRMMLDNKTLLHKKPTSKDDSEMRSYPNQKLRMKLRNGGTQMLKIYQIDVVCNCVYPRSIGGKLWRDTMIMLDTLDWTELWTY